MNTASFIVTLIGTIATVGAAWLAYATIRESKAASAENELALVRERRIDFELRALTDLATLTQGRISLDDRKGPIAALALMLPRELLPLTRIAYSLESNEAAREQYDQAVKESQQTGFPVTEILRPAILAEILRAIQGKFDQRAVRGQWIEVP